MKYLSVVTDMDKQVIEQYRIKDQRNRLRKTFRHWKKSSHFSQQARYMAQRLLLRRSDLTVSFTRKIF